MYEVTQDVSVNLTQKASYLKNVERRLDKIVINGYLFLFKQ